MQNFKNISKMNLRIRTHTFRAEDKMHAILLLPGISRQQTVFLTDLRFFFNGAMVQSICDCGAVQPPPPHFVLFLYKICAEIIVNRMFAVSLNGLNGKNSSRSIVQNLFFFGLFVLF